MPWSAWGGRHYLPPPEGRRCLSGAKICPKTGLFCRLWCPRALPECVTAPGSLATRALLRLLGFNQVPRVPVQPMPFSSACSRFRFRSSFSLPRQHSEGARRRTQPLASLRDKFYWELRFFFNPLSPSSLFPHLLLALCFALQCVKKNHQNAINVQKNVFDFPSHFEKVCNHF